MVLPSPPADLRPSQELAALADAYWQVRLESDPIEATLFGDHRFGDRLPDRTPEGLAKEASKRRAILADVRAIDPEALRHGDRITRRTLIGELENDLALIECDVDAWAVDPMSGPQVRLLNLAQLYRPATVEQGRALVLRWSRIGSYIDDQIANLRRGLALGKVATRETTARVIAQVDKILEAPDEAWVLTAPAKEPHDDWPAAELLAFREGVKGAVSERIRPAFKRYRDVLSSEVLPASRGDDRVGVSNLPGGAECYSSFIMIHTSVAMTAQEIHEAGLEEIAAIRREMIELGGKVFGTRDLPAIQRRLRADPAHFFSTRDEVEAKAAEALARAAEAFQRWFGRAPSAPCVVRRIDAFEEEESTIAYYLQPAADGSRPGTYYINTFAPETRPRYEAEALAFHEAIPGHHSQIAIAQELDDIPEFRRHAGVTAYVEGWALYTERLAEEMGLYSSDLDRIGMWSFSAWRASRLVVDTGMHALGWSRGDAIRYMLENTFLAENNIVTEVDRYINWPGQALAYKIGERAILKLRAEAERRLGPKFDIKAFHDTLLENGAVSLPVLEEEAERWIASVSARA